MGELNLLNKFISACQDGDLEYMQECIRLMSSDDINSVCDERRFCAIHHAVRLESIEFIRLLLAVDSIDLRKRTFDGQTPLMSALEKYCPIEIIRLLIERDPALIDIPNDKGIYPMHRAITIRRSLPIVKLMVETLKQNGLPLNDHIEPHGAGSILLAAHCRNSEMLEYLIENAPDNELRLRALFVLTRPLSIYFNGNEDSVCRVLQRLFIKMTDEAKIPAMVNEAIPAIKRTIESLQFGYTDWFIEKVYLDPMNEHHEIAGRVFDSMKNLNWQRNKYTVILPLHSHVKSETFAKCWTKHIWKEMYQDALDVLQNDFGLFRQWCSVFHEKCPMRVDFVLSIFVFRFIFHVNWNESSIVGLIAGTNTRELMGNTHRQTIFTEKIERLLKEKEEGDQLRALTVLMPFTTAICADDLIEVNAPLTVDSIGRFFSQRFHKNALPLTMLCRLVIRKAVFPPVKMGKNNTTELERLMSLPVPNALKNFLRFNYTNYDLTKDCNRALA